MRVYVACDHAGFALKNDLILFLRGLGNDLPGREFAYDVEDLGAHRLDPEDDYPDFVVPLAKLVVSEFGSRGIVIGASGQGEAMACNRILGARAAVYYGEALHKQTDRQGLAFDIVESARAHNDANILSLGARFISVEEAKHAAKTFLEEPFSNESRHARRLAKLDDLSLK